MTRPDRVALATVHGKEAAIAPPLARLGIAVVVPPSLDTDRFGTFSGEIARTGTMLDAARAKADAAMEATGLAVAIASEGSYGPHPVIPLLARGQELMLWWDRRSGQEIVETLIDDAPAFDTATVTDLAEADAFLSRIGFPDVAVVIAAAQLLQNPVAKGVRDRDEIAATVGRLARVGPVLLATDMRAHMNRRRMETIARLSERFAERIARPCPVCAAPGWGVLRIEPGLPCAACGTPTPVARGEVFGCTACGTTRFVPRADGRTEADPGHCVLCNP